MFVVMGVTNSDGSFSEVVTVSKKLALIKESDRQKYDYINENVPNDVAENINDYKVEKGELVLKQN